jgi:hypothetical protein
MRMRQKARGHQVKQISAPFASVLIVRTRHLIVKYRHLSDPIAPIIRTTF